jgi:hypothetical protein
MSHPEERTIPPWTEHPILSTLTDEQRERLISLVPTGIKDEPLARMLKIPAAVVATARRARRNEKTRLRRAAENQRDREERAAAAQPASPTKDDPRLAFLRRLQAVYGPRGVGDDLATVRPLPRPVRAVRLGGVWSDAA